MDKMVNSGIKISESWKQKSLTIWENISSWDWASKYSTRESKKINNSEIFSSTSNAMLFFVSWKNTANVAAQSTSRTVVGLGQLWSPCHLQCCFKGIERDTGRRRPHVGKQQFQCTGVLPLLKVLTQYKHPVERKVLSSASTVLNPCSSKWCEERAHGYVMKNSHLLKSLW